MSTYAYQPVQLGSPSHAMPHYPGRRPLSNVLNPSYLPLHSHASSRLSSAVTFASDASTTIPDVQLEDVELGMLQRVSSSDERPEEEGPLISEPRRFRPMAMSQPSKKVNVLRKKTQARYPQNSRNSSHSTFRQKSSAWRRASERFILTIVAIGGIIVVAALGAFIVVWADKYQRTP